MIRESGCSDVQKMPRDLDVEENIVDMAKNIEKFICLPQGAYGVVYRARDSSGRYVALKKIRISLTTDGIPMTTLREISLLKNLDSYSHPHIVK